MPLNKLVSTIILGLVVVFMSGQPILAGEPLSEEEVLKIFSNNMSEEYVTCAAFYSISSEGLRRSGDMKTAAKLGDNKAQDFLRDSGIDW